MHAYIINGSPTCSFWLQGLDGQTSAQPSKPFPLLSDGTYLVAVSSLPESVDNGKNFLVGALIFDLKNSTWDALIRETIIIDIRDRYYSISNYTN